MTLQEEQYDESASSGCSGLFTTASLCLALKMLHDGSQRYSFWYSFSGQLGIGHIFASLTGELSCTCSAGEWSGFVRRR